MRIDQALTVYFGPCKPDNTCRESTLAIMDWAMRKFLSKRLPNTLNPRFCGEALEEAIENTASLKS